MPAVAVLAGVAGATSLATAGVAGLGLFGTIGAIGGIVSAVGAVTGSKDLMKIGGIAALAGGVGAFATNQGWLASASATETAAGATQGGAIEAMKNAASGAEAVSPTAGLAEANLAQQEASGLFNADKLSPLGMESGTATAGLVDSTTDLMAQKNPLLDTSSSASITNPTDARLSLGTQTTLPPGSTFTLGANTLSPAGSGNSILDTLKGFGDWAEKNKTLASIGANFIGGAFDKRKAAEVDLLKAQTAALQQQAANANDVPKLGLKLTPKASIFRTQPVAYNAPMATGLFNAR